MEEDITHSSSGTDSQDESIHELYDEDADQQDAMWMAERHPDTTDAVLSCPGCFTQICFVCQHHSRFPGQYRALSTEHCSVRPDTYAFGKAGLMVPSSTGEFRLVVCAECGTKVGVIDHNNVYHLFHVLASSS
ncbi:hypothetical protein GGI25_002874 [Coemansia spiralis]|uniref:E2F-associated phosphoprotein n=2 Tax=Coemansia TaxID=4863 RepID=A0A9W8KYL6_9FUNG|nr:hypothetical protein EDC05_002845 [Coemansia umbellata]KAJ2622271.1 hypothetical protein GGI26_003424 [Coemansia sp. RSA 1358]KAJ2677776.1 hypothetical protein GGI25_002874 [Coemansia spiralis]